MNLAVRRLPISAKRCHNSILLRRRLDAVEAPLIPAGYEFREANEGDFASISAHPEARLGDVYERRVRRGERCYCLLREGAVVCFNWVSDLPPDVLSVLDHTAESHPRQEGLVYTRDFYTYEAARGQGIGRLMKRAMLQTLAESDFREVYTMIQPHSRASLKIHLELDYEPVCMIYGYRVLRWQRAFHGKDREQAWLDAWIEQFRTETGISGPQKEPSAR